MHRPERGLRLNFTQSTETCHFLLERGNYAPADVAINTIFYLFFF